MLSQFIKKTQNRINFTKNLPNHGIKCSECQLIYPVDQIERHMMSHIAPQYMAPNTKSNHIKKMGRPKLFLQEKQNSFMETALKTVKRDEMPRKQNVRKLKGNPQNYKTLPTNYTSQMVSYQNESLKIDHSQIETNFEIRDVQKEFLERQQIQQDMVLNRQNVQVKKPKLQVYAAEKQSKIRNSFNNSTQLSWANSTKIQSRNWQNKKNQDSINETQTHAYEISQKRMPKLLQFLPAFKTQPQQRCQVRIQKHKAPQVRSQSICTKSNKSSQLNKNTSFKFLASFFGCSEAPKDLKRGQITVNMDNTASTAQAWRSQNVSPIKNNKHQCHNCGGFYCQTCHSTIPPQYRPANIHSGRDEKTKQFYEKFVYRNKCETFRGQSRKSQQQCKNCNQ